MFRLDRTHKVRAPRSLPKFRTRLSVEALESRIVPYSVYPGGWAHPNMLTISFVPDGTIVGTTSSGPAYSNLFATMNATFGSPSIWESQILQAAQTWAQQTNVNFEVVSDNGTTIGQGAYQQGDPGMGDIRIGGYNIGSGVLAQTVMPPSAGNYSIVGDMQFNTAMPFSIGSAAYDLYSVALHEFGHAVSLNESSVTTAVMYQYYHGVLSGLTSDDIAGVQAAYGVRAPDYFDTYAPNNTWQTSTDLTGYINPISKTVLMPNMDITTTSDVDWYVVQAPSGTTSTPMILVQSWLQSMLRPQVQVYGNGYLVGSGSVGSPLGGSLLVVNLSGVTAGEMLYVEVSGESANALGTGKYSLSLNFGTGPTPSVGMAYTTTANGNPLQLYSGPEYDLVPPAASTNSATVPARTGVVIEAAGLQASRVAPPAATTVALTAASLTGPALAPSLVLAAPLAASLPAGNVIVVQPAALLLEGTTDNAPAEDTPAPPTGPLSVPAPETMAARPEQASRALPAPARGWAEASTAYFTVDSVRLEQTASSLGDGPSGMALEAALAVAGFVAVAGENRFTAAGITDEERQRRLRG